MAYREVSVFEIKEVLRLWLRGEGYRGIDRLSGIDRKTARRYVEAAVEVGLARDGGEAQLTDVPIGLVCNEVRPARPAGHGQGWESLVPHEAEVKAWLAKDVKLVKTWCSTTAGLRTHGTTQCRPLEVFRLEEAPLLLPAPTERYDLPLYAKPKVHRDHHIEVDKALYSVPGNLIGFRVHARADALVVKVFHRGQLIKVHPRQRQGGRHTDACDLPTGAEVYAMRDIEALKRMAAGHGPSVGAYAAALLDSPLPWTRMRQVYWLLGLTKKWGPQRVEAACARALEAEAVDVGLISRMLERATENAPPPPATGAGASNVIPGRFSRDASEFATDEGAGS